MSSDLNSILASRFKIYHLGYSTLGVNSIDYIKDAFSCSALFSYYFFLKKNIFISFPSLLLKESLFLFFNLILRSYDDC